MDRWRVVRLCCNNKDTVVVLLPHLPVVCGLGKGRNWLSAEGRRPLGSSDERNKPVFPLRAGKFPCRQSTGTAAFLIGMNKMLHQGLEPMRVCSSPGFLRENQSINEERSITATL